MGRTCSGCGSGARQTLSRYGFRVIDAGDGLPDTLLGFETTGPSPLCPDGGEPGVIRAPGGGGFVLLPRFGGGVWCLICG